MIFGYARESVFRNYPSLKDQGRGIVYYCTEFLDREFKPNLLYVDYHRPGGKVSIPNREAAFTLLRRAKKGDIIIVQAFYVLFASAGDVKNFPIYLKDGEVDLHLVDKGKSVAKMTGEELMVVIKEAKKMTAIAQGVSLVPDGQTVFGKTRWIKVPGEYRDWVKVAEQPSGKLIPIVLKASRYRNIENLDPETQAIERRRLEHTFENWS